MRESLQQLTRDTGYEILLQRETCKPLKGQRSSVKLGKCNALRAATPLYGALTRKDSGISANVSKEFVAMKLHL